MRHSILLEPHVITSVETSVDAVVPELQERLSTTAFHGSPQHNFVCCSNHARPQGRQQPA